MLDYNEICPETEKPQITKNCSSTKWGDQIDRLLIRCVLIALLKVQHSDGHFLLFQILRHGLLKRKCSLFVNKQCCRKSGKTAVRSSRRAGVRIPRRTLERTRQNKQSSIRAEMPKLQLKQEEVYVKKKTKQ